VPVDGLVRPPTIDDAPFLAHELHVLTVHDMWRPTRPGLDERRPWSV
jgi:hypothetical protein